MEIQMKQATPDKKKRTKPADYFKKCPKCGDKELFHLDPDVVCLSCDWDSTVWDVSRGAMNDLGRAAKEFFAATSKTQLKKVLDTKAKTQNPEDKNYFNQNRKGA